MGKPTTSIIILIRSESDLEFLDKAIKSLENQTYQNYELIFVCMWDEKKLRDYIKTCFDFSPTVKIKILPQDQVLKVGQATNIGFKEAQGKYVVRLDPDDEFDENLLLVSISFLEENPQYKATHPDFFTINKLGEIIDYGSPEVSFNLNPLDAGVVYNREAVLLIGGYSENLSRQVSYELQIRFKSRFSMKEIHLPLYRYRKHNYNYSKGTEEILVARHKIVNEGKVLCVIPARGGSKGIPKKNLKELNGIPMLHYAIQAAKEAKMVDKIIVSTDDSEIFKEANSLEVDAIIRPDYLCKDEVSIIPVAKYHLEEQEENISAVVCLQVTSPLVLASDIDEGLIKFFSTRCDSVVSIYKVSHNHPFRVMKRVQDRMFPFSDSYDERVLDRRDLPDCYAFNGAFFIRKPELLLNYDGKDFGLGKDVRGLVMPEERSVNVDTNMDLLLAEFLLEKRQTDKNKQKTLLKTTKIDLESEKL